MAQGIKTVSIIGLGYIGLPTAATIASRGIKVIGVDVNEQIVNKLNAGQAHFSEPDLDALLSATVATGQLRAVTEPQTADAYLITVPTPFNADHSADLSYIESAGRALAKVLQKGNLVVLESTSPIGTTDKLCNWLAEERPDLSFPNQDSKKPDINMAYCPERIIPGHMLYELVENARIIGGMTPKCTERAKELYSTFVLAELFPTTAHTAELVKLMENSYRDVNIAYANEMAGLCDKYGLNVWEAIKLANKHPRVDILNPGPGVGGHCIAIDPWFLISDAPEHTRLIRAARDLNDSRPDVILGKARKKMAALKEPVVACLGLTYKPDIDDLRQSPALQITETLAREGNGKILVVEPNVDTLPRSLENLDTVEYVTLENALARANIVLLLVSHKQFKGVNPVEHQDVVYLDTVGLWQ